MKQLSRKKIQDMIDLNGANISSRRSSGGSGAGGGGGVSSAWVDEHYVSKDFFARLFTINGTDENDDDVVVEPNDLDTDITNIQAMVGLWTEEYLSALGQGSGGGGGGGDTLVEPLASINESSLGAPTDANVVIAWDGVRWSYKPYVTGGGGGGGTLTSIGMSVPTGFKVSNGDSQTITTSGTFALSFGGSIAKNRVLASPSDAAGAPSWRTLVASDIPTLTASKISDIGISNDTITIGSNSITPLTDATLKSNYTWWGQAMNNNGAVTGSITVGNGYILLNNDKGIYSYNVPAEGESAAPIEMMRLRSNNWARLFYGTADAGYSTLIYGNLIALRYGADGTNGLVITSSGLVTIGTSSTSSFVTEKLNVNGNIRTATANGSYIQIGAVRLVYDSTNTAIKVEKSDGTAAGLYATGFLSALGAGSGGGGGSTTLTEPLASINEAGLGTTSAANQVIAWNGSQWSYMPFTANTGTVTSVNGSAASGSHLTVTGGPITTSGTLTIGLGSGYSIPKTSKQTNWDTAYSWVNTNGATVLDAAHTHSNKSVLDGISSTNVLNWGTAYSWVNTNGASTVTKTAWGQTYWNAGTPQTISGTITVGNGDIVMNNNKGIKFLDVPAEGSSAAQREVLRLSNYNTLLIGQGATAAGYNTRLYGNAISFRYGTSGSIGMTLDSSGNLGIGTSSPSVKLDVNGYAKTTRLYLSSSVYLEYDSSNSGVHLVGAGLYTDTYVSALGAGSGGGSASGITMADVWSAMAAPAPSTAQEQIEASHLTQALSGYASKTWVQNRGYLTSNEAVTLSTAQTISAAKIFGAGLKSYSICIETKIDGTADTNRSGEINRYGSDLHLQYHNQTGYTAGGITMCNNGGSVAIGYSSQDSNYKLKVNGKVRISDQIGVNTDVESDAQCMLNINGTAKSLGWNSYSDIWLKDVINPVTASVEDIANVRIFDFRWKKDGENGKIHFGSAAQDWQTIFPHAVVADKEGFLSMDYAGIAVGAVKTVAQEVVLLKKRVAELEKQLKAS